MTPPRNSANELTSWKEIAAYLHVNVRTAQKWERDRGMPVQRLPGGRGRVAIRIADLETWKNFNKDAPVELPFWTRRKRWAALILILVLVVLIGFAPAANRLDRKPASTRIEGNNLIVVNSHGYELWRKGFPCSIEPTSEMIRLKDTVSRAWVMDLDGDGSDEVLFRVRYPLEIVTQPLICYSANGAEKWRYAPTETVRTPHEEFPPVYNTRTVAILPDGKGKPMRVLATFSHIPNYPTQVALLSAQGRVIREYWHSGHLSAAVIADLDHDGKPEIYLGGIANSRKAAAIVALDPENFGGASDESNSPDYQLLGLGPENVRTRVILGRTRINREFWSSNGVTQLELIPSGILAEVQEYSNPLATIHYEFGPGLSLRGVDVADGYEILYKALAAKGLIDWKYNDLEEEDRLKKSLLYLKPEARKF